MITAVLLSVLCGTAVLVLEPVRSRPPLTVDSPAPSTSGARRVRRPTPDGAVLLDLLAAVLDAGLAVDAGLGVLAPLHPDSVGPPLQRFVAARRLGADWNTATAVALVEAPATSAAPPDAVEAVRQLLEAVSFAATTGAPSAALLRARAAELRATRRRETERKANALGVRLVLPLGLCQLPAFICLGVAPVVIALLPLLAG